MSKIGGYIKNRQPKFTDCIGCRFYNRFSRHPNPICASCDSGEFFEEKSARRPSDNDLINEFKDFFDE